MDASTSREPMEQYLAALQRGDDFAQYFVEDVRWTSTGTGDELQGKEAARDYIVALHTQALDARMEVTNLVVGEDGAALEAELVGTRTGEFAGIPATGASLRVPYAGAYDLSPDGITALRAYVPVAHMINQLRQAQTAGVAAGG